MPSSTYTLTATVPDNLADEYGLAAGAGRTAGNVITVDDQIGLNLIRQGYAQRGDYTVDADAPTSSDIAVLLTATVPDALADSLGLATGAGRAAGTTVDLPQNSALQLVRADLGEFVDAQGAASTGHNPHTIASAVLDFPSVAAAGQAELTVDVDGAAVGDPVVVGAPAALEAGLVVGGRVSAADVVTVRVTNVTAAPIDPASATWKVAVVKF